jgi:arylsulfatase A-like enzyme
MSGQVLGNRTTSAPGSGSARTPGSRGRLGALDILVLSVWCGLAGGLLEVGARTLCRAIDPTKRLYMMTRHFVWLTPLANLVLFIALGLCLTVVTRIWPRRGAWLSSRLIVLLALLPALWVAGPRIYQEAWFVVALGIASRVVPWLERDPTRWRRRLLGGSAGLVGLVLILAGFVGGGEWLRQRREAGRPLPPAGSPNVLLIVMDTVRADHLSLYGYERPTTPTLERMAQQGIRFDEARATAPWTLASHASFFTGRWPHELDVRWLTPLRGRFPTLAEYLGSRGYATAGFVANTTYCSYDTGLDRGFAHYEDYVLERLSPLRTAGLIDAAVKALSRLALVRGPGSLPRLEGLVSEWFASAERKRAARINREFLGWIAGRREPGRPFFAFLNYLDTHTPYLLPPGVPYRFGVDPETSGEALAVLMGWSLLDKLRLPRPYWNLARDAYDNCVAYLDDQLGVLFDELRRRGILANSLVIVLSDHGEALGDHSLFQHGESLYRMEIRVPLLILTPARAPSGRVIRETVSLRDLPATVVDLIGLEGGSPFPGRSLARSWEGRPAAESPSSSGGALSELASPNPLDPNQGRSPAHRGPLISLAEDGLVYIRNEGDQTEELFDERDDPRELTNRARQQAMQGLVRRFRDRIGRMKVDLRNASR